MRERSMVPCPHCGEPVPHDAVCCRHCGSDAETGWNDDIDYHSVEIPDDLTSFDDGGLTEGPRSRSLRARDLAIIGALTGGGIAIAAIARAQWDMSLDRSIMGALFGVIIVSEVLFRCGVLSTRFLRRDSPQ